MEKIKLFLESGQGKDIMTVFIVILVGLGSFGLGRLSKNNPNEGLKIEYRDQGASGVLATESSQYVPQLKPDNTTTDKAFFASSRGTKYYPLGCSAGQNIKQENRIYFNTAEEAEKAGYSLSSSC